MANDSWRTPPEVFNTLNAEFGFVADMACDEDNKLCDIGFTEENNSLSFSWAERVWEMCTQGNPRYVWCNPPYSNPMPWVRKALESQRDGLGVVMLLNQDTSVGWYAEALKGVSDIRHIIGDKKPGGGYSSGRLAFFDADGKPAKGNNKAQMVLVFNPFKIGHAVTTYISKKEIMGEL